MATYPTQSKKPSVLGAECYFTPYLDRKPTNKRRQADAAGMTKAQRNVVEPGASQRKRIALAVSYFSYCYYFPV